MWRDFVDWEARLNSPEIPFLVRQFRNRTAQVLDACLGDGFDSIQLLKQGMNVTSNDIDPHFIEKALENASHNGVTLNVTTHNWLEIDRQFPEDHFGGIFCLGNSLTYLFSQKDQLRALENFRKILAKDGVLIIDERNYQYFLDKREQILEGDFNYSHQVVYCGKKVDGRPIEISDQKVVMQYTHAETGERGYLELYPFKRGELRKLLKRAGFQIIHQYSDYQETFNPDADFYQYVCAK